MGVTFLGGCGGRSLGTPDAAPPVDASSEDAGGPPDAAADAATDAAVEIPDPCPTLLGCHPTDADGDGHGAPGCGDDCDDASALVYPGAADVVGDGIDQSCDRVDGEDRDGDGLASLASGGQDCDDEDHGSHPGANDNEGWAFEFVSDGLLADSAALALDDHGRPHLAFQLIVYDGDRCDVADDTMHRYQLLSADRQGGLWALDILDSRCSAGYQGSTAFAVDDSNAVHIAYMLGEGDVRHALSCGARSVIESLQPQGSRSLALSLDGDGVEHVVHIGPQAGLLLHEFGHHGDWVEEPVEETGAVSGMSMVIDPMGGARVAFVGTPSQKSTMDTNVHLASRSDNVWDVEEIDSADYSLGPVGIGWDPLNGVPIVAWGDEEGVHYSARQAGRWQTNLIDASGTLRGTWMAVGPDGLARVSWRGADAIRIATALESGDWSIEDIAPSTATPVPIAVDQAGGVHVVFFREGDGLVYGVRREGLDGVDQNCDGVDGVDADGDGRASIDTGGDDPDDAAR